MTIDEAIVHAREVASEQKRRSGICVQNNSECDKFSACLKCSKEHEQLAEWLEELKILREEKSEFQIIAKDIAEYNYEMGMENGYNKAVDDLLEDANEMAIEVDVDTYTMKAIGIGLLENIAEQLKAGGENETDKS